MIPLTERQQIMQRIGEAQSAGARRQPAWAVVGISLRTLQRWQQAGSLNADGRTTRRVVPANRLSQSEREQVLAIANSAEFAACSPSQIVPILAERGDYLASESTFYRVLRDARQLRHRQTSRPTNPGQQPRTLVATRPNQVYTWDITYLRTTVKGVFVYLYCVIDLYSRKLVGWQVYAEESSEHASDLFRDIAAQEDIQPDQVTVHSDNGAPMKGASLLATLQALGIAQSLSRPAVSNDNPYSESLFRTLKYRPNYPVQPFTGVADARDWVAGFVDWYNHTHRHSSIRFVTPAQRHAGEEIAILAQRHAVYQAARKKHPERWQQGKTRNGTPVEAVYLNPVKNKDGMAISQSA